MGRLLRILGVTFGLAVAIGNTIGAGILRAPGEIATHVPVVPLYLAIWVIGGAYALLGANALAELGVAVPQSGGQYVFVRRALGEYAGFVVGWSDWLSTCGSMAAVAMVIGEYSLRLLPLSERSTIWIALAIILFFAAIQSRGVKWGSRAQEITTAMKALVFVALIAACFALAPSRPVAPATAHAILLAGVILSLQQVIYTYDGWSAVVYFSEEVKVPRRDIPRALFGTVALVTVIYLLVNVGFLVVLPLASLAGQPLAAGAVAERIFGPTGDTVLRVLMIVSMLSTINAFALMASRVLFALGRDRLFARRVADVNEGGTPAIALWTGTIVAALFLLTRTFDRAIALLAFFFVANYALSFLSLFVLRRREPELSASHRAWGHPWTTGLALAASLAFLGGAIASDTWSSIVSLLLLGASYPVYRLIVRGGLRDA